MPYTIQKQGSGWSMLCNVLNLILPDQSMIIFNPIANLITLLVKVDIPEMAQKLIDLYQLSKDKVLLQ